MARAGTSRDWNPLVLSRKRDARFRNRKSLCRLGEGSVRRHWPEIWLYPSVFRRMPVARRLLEMLFRSLCPMGGTLMARFSGVARRPGCLALEKCRVGWMCRRRRSRIQRFRRECRRIGPMSAGLCHPFRDRRGRFSDADRDQSGAPAPPTSRATSMRSGSTWSFGCHKSSSVTITGLSASGAHTSTSPESMSMIQ